MIDFEVHRPDGRAVTGRVDGPQAGPLIVSLHGTPGSRFVEAAVVDDVVRRGARIASLDRPGYGGSARHPGRSVADVVDDIAAVADHLAAERFVVTGASGGGPHALACAWALEDRVPAVCALASPAPYGAEGLDWLDGMGEDNIEEYSTTLAGETVLRPMLDAFRDGMLASTPQDMIDSIASLVSPVDREALTYERAQAVQDSVRLGIEGTVDGWIDDDVAFVSPWGFAVEAIRTPVLLGHGGQDRFVPFAHGEWLAARIPGVDARLHPDHGHLSLFYALLSESNDWLLAHL